MSGGFAQRKQLQCSLEQYVISCQQLVILLTNEVAEPYVLWDQFKTRLCDDVKYKLHHMNYYQANQEIPEDNVYDYGLWDLNISGNGKKSC